VTGKTWFITGCSRGFGRIWAHAALERGDRVAVTARNPDSLGEFSDKYGDSALLLPLDVTDALAVREAVHRAHDHFGRLDVVVNNAGFALLGAIEEVDEADVRAVFETNFFGTFSVIQAALPLLRAQGSGHLISVTSLAGLIGEPSLGIYNASKWAVEGMSDALSQEVAHLGISVTLIEPGPYATEFGSENSLRVAPEISAYSEARHRLMTSFDPGDVGDPQATAQVMLKLVDETNPPRRLTLGKVVRRRAREHYEARLATWDEWAEDSDLAHGASH